MIRMYLIELLCLRFRGCSAAAPPCPLGKLAEAPRDILAQRLEIALSERPLNIAAWGWGVSGGSGGRDSSSSRGSSRGSVLSLSTPRSHSS